MKPGVGLFFIGIIDGRRHGHVHGQLVNIHRKIGRKDLPIEFGYICVRAGKIFQDVMESDRNGIPARDSGNNDAYFIGIAACRTVLKSQQ